MKLGKVIGNVVATVKDPGLEGLRFLVIQGLDDNFQPIGDPFVAADGIYTAGEGDIVYLVSKKEAAFAIHRDLVPIDECVVGFVEEYTVVEAAKKINDRAKRILEIKTEITKKAERKRPPKVKTPPKKPIKTKVPPSEETSPKKPIKTKVPPSEETPPKKPIKTKRPSPKKAAPKKPVKTKRPPPKKSSEEE